MKTFYNLLISLLFFSNTFSQNSISEKRADSSSIIYPPSLSMNKNNFKKQFSDKVHLSLQTGLSFYSIGKQNIFDKWIAPAITYNLTSKFHFTIGTVAMFSNPGYFQSNLNKEGVNTFSQNINTRQYFLFAQGEYLLNSRIMLRGSILKEVPNNPINPYSLNVNRVGVDIKISDGFSISADCMVAKVYNSSLTRNYNELNFPSFPLNGGFYNRAW